MANQNKRQNSASGGLYIALAICILSVICIGVYSAIINVFETPYGQTPVLDEVKNKNDSTPKPTTPTVSTKLPSFTTPTPSTTTPPPEEVKPQDNGEVEKEPDYSVNYKPEPPTYTLPVAGDVSSPFSDDVLVYSQTMNDYRVHNGVDISATLGTPVKAFTDGVVINIYEDPLMGQTVVLDHGGQVLSIYQNLSPTLPEGIEVGVKVNEGDVIGGVGETVLIECAEIPHLHFEVTENGKHVDPMKYFQ